MSYTFTPSKFYGYLLNIEPNNLVFLKTYNTELDDITKKLTDQNGTLLEIEDKNDRLLEIEDKVNLRLLINKHR